MNDESQPEQHSTTSHSKNDQTSSSKPLPMSLDWDEAVLLLSNLYHRMEASLPEINRDISIPKDQRRAAILNIRGEMKGILKGIEGCKRMANIESVTENTHLLGDPSNS